jgi:hypothetical protein
MLSDPFRSAGALRAEYERVDWGSTPLGPVSGWSPTLLTTVDLMLGNRFPVTLLWGPDLVLVYNQAYVELIADKHPAALGACAEDVFPEAWDTIGPMLKDVLAGGGTTWSEDVLLPLNRAGFLEECHFSFSYSAVRDPAAHIVGVVDICTETTASVVVRRRLQLLNRLSSELAEVDHVGDVPARALEVLRADPADLPAVDVRLRGVPSPHGAGDLPRRPAGAAPLTEPWLEERPEGRTAWLPLSVSNEPVGRSHLAVRLSDMIAVDDDYLGFLSLVAAAISQAMTRVSVREAERNLSEALQRSLLTKPPGSGDLQVAVRYQPAAEQAQVGGDWYDAFLLPDGALTMVVGDVAGHDQEAAASMGQLRNLVRGVAYSLEETPAGVLRGLDRAMDGLDVGVIATAVLAQVQEREAGGHGRVRLSWSNAGHPPPVLIGADGRARLLETDPDLLLGLDHVTERADHSVTLGPGDALLIYTDGLVERRGVALHESLEWLVKAVEGRSGLDPEELCNHLLGLIEGRAEDDIALLVVRSNAA